MSLTSPVYTYLHAGTGLCTSFNKNSEYDQEIPQSQVADNPVAPRVYIF